VLVAQDHKGQHLNYLNLRVNTRYNRNLSNIVWYLSCQPTTILVSTAWFPSIQSQPSLAPRDQVLTNQEPPSMYKTLDLVLLWHERQCSAPKALRIWLKLKCLPLCFSDISIILEATWLAVGARQWAALLRFTCPRAANPAPHHLTCLASHVPRVNRTFNSGACANLKYKEQILHPLSIVYLNPVLSPLSSSKLYRGKSSFCSHRNGSKRASLGGPESRNAPITRAIFSVLKARVRCL